ncbi:MAG: leucine-rich repeat domain-containing protein [Treponema sp.]|nr:leucine-rich repeat domain-containing protein [Treponema sp.]
MKREAVIKINEKTGKGKIFILNSFLISIISFFIFSGCPDIFRQPDIINDNGNGAVLLYINGEKSARTIMPDISMDDYIEFKLDFTAKTAGNSNFSITWTGSSGSVELSAGTWELVITAFLAGENQQSVEAAKSKTETIAVASGSVVPADIVLFPIENGSGKYKWNISFNYSFKNAVMEIWRRNAGANTFTLLNDKTVKLIENNITQTLNLENEVTLDAGEYRVDFILSNGEDEAVISHILHIYKNMNSFFEEVFSDRHIPAALLRYILRTWDASEKTWKLSEAGISADHFSMLGINGVNDSNFNNIIISFNALCAVNSIPGNLTEFKTLTDAAFVKTAVIETNIQNAGNYANQVQAETAIRAFVQNNTFLLFNWEADNKTVTVQSGIYEIDIAFNASLKPPTTGFEFTLINNNTAYSVSGGSITDTDVIIPAFYNGLPVTQIASATYNSGYTGGFANYTSMTSLAIPSSVTSIGSNAFYGCSGLTSITITSSVTSIGDYAFSYCSGLTNITIPSSVTSIGSSAFSSCSGLISLTVESGNTIYRSEGNCIIRITNNELITGCKNSIIPSSVTSIGSSAFSGCSGLTSITIPSSVTSIGGSAFRGCSGLTSITISSSVTSIGNSAFWECSGLTSITIPSSVTSIGSSAFWECSGLTSIIIPSSVISIGSNAFSFCSGLTSITIPSSVTSIGSNAFISCSGLTSITVESGNTIYRSEGNCIIRIANNELIAGCKNSIIPSSVTSIGGSAFWGCSGLTSITIPSSVTSIGTYAFYYCSGLTSITIPSSVTSIGNSAFYSCSGLASIIIPSSVISIGNEAFNNCSKLNSVYYTGDDSSEWNNMVIGTENTALTSSTIYYYRENDPGTSYTHWRFVAGKPLVWNTQMSATPGLSFTLINGNAYSVSKGTATAPDVIIPSLYEGLPVTTLANQCFENYYGLTSISIPSSVTNIGSNAFRDCSGLTSITVESGNTIYRSEGNCIIRIANNELIAGCKNSIIPSNVTSIGSSAFYGCSGLTSITIPSGVTSIGSSAFYGCTGLTSITIPTSVTSIVNTAFYVCSGLTKVFYGGVNSTAWNGITIGSLNTNLTSANRYYYSVTHPGTADTHWRWVGGVATVWE